MTGRTEYMRAYRARGGDADTRRARNRAMNLATAWIIDEHPDVWGEILDRAYADLDLERRGPGRPRKSHP